MATTTDLEKQFYELYIATPPANITDLKNAFLSAVALGGTGVAQVIEQVGTTRTLSATDSNKVIYCTSASATTITMGSGLPAGFNCTIIQGSTGKVTLTSGGLILLSYSSLFSTMGPYAIISVLSPETDVFIAAGNLGV